VKLKHLYLLVLAAAAYVAMLVYGISAEERTRAMQARLEADFRALPSFPKATKADQHEARKLGQCYIGATYASSAGLPEIRAYYDSLLLRRGWRVDSSRPVGVGGYIIDYKKDPLTASLQYVGDGTSGWDYAFSLSWGLH